MKKCHEGIKIGDVINRERYSHREVHESGESES